MPRRRSAKRRLRSSAFRRTSPPRTSSSPLNTTCPLRWWPIRTTLSPKPTAFGRKRACTDANIWASSVRRSSSTRRAGSRTSLLRSIPPATPRKCSKLSRANDEVPRVEYRLLARAVPFRAPTAREGFQLTALDQVKALDASPEVGFGYVKIALGIHSHGVAVGEVADLVAGAAEGGKDLAACVIENMDRLVAAVHHGHELLLRVA